MVNPPASDPPASGDDAKQPTAGAGTLDDDPGTRPVPPARRIVRWLVVLFGLLLVAWAAAAAWSALTAAQALEEARGHLPVARQLLTDAELQQARAEIEEVVAAASMADERLTAVHMTPLRILPWVGPNLAAAGTLSVAAREVGRDTLELLDTATAVLAEERSGEPGQIPIGDLEDLATPTRAFSLTLQRQLTQVQQLDPDPLVARTVEAREMFLELVEPNVEQAVLLADLLEVLPGFLGGQEPRTYLVGAASLSELRGTGGLLGSWSVLRAADGHLTFEEFIDVGDMPRSGRAVAAPTPEFGLRYAGFQALGNWRTANLSPDFPAVAEVLMAMYEDGGGAPVDGIVLADTITFERLATRAGGVEVPDVGRLDPSEVLRFVGLEAYDTFDSDEERKRVLGAVATATFAELVSVLAGDDLRATIEMLGSLAEGGHLLVHTRDEAFQGVARRAGIAGELPATAGESAGVYVNNLSENKVDFFAGRVVEHRVQVLEDGWTQADIEVEFGNDAPTDGFSQYVLGPNVEDLAAGDARWLATFTCGLACELLDSPRDDHVGGSERGRSMHEHLVDVGAGDTTTLRYRTSTPDGWTQAQGLVTVAVQHLAQPTIQGVDLQVSVEVPADHTVVEWSEGGRIEGGSVVWAFDAAAGQIDVDVVFAPPE